MATIKTQGGKVVLKDGKASCECCVICNQNPAASHYRAVAISADQFNMFLAGGRVEIGSFSFEAEITWKQIVQYANQTWALMPQKTVTYSATHGTMSVVYATENTCSVITRYSGSWTTQTCSDGSLCYIRAQPPWFDSEGTLVQPVIPTNLRYFRYTHTLSDIETTIGGITSQHWLIYSVSVGAAFLSLDGSYYSGTGLPLPNPNFQSGIGAKFEANISTRDPVGSPTTSTGQSVNANLNTPLGNIALALTDVSSHSVGIPYQLVGPIVTTWTSYPTFTWIPSAP